MEMFLRWATWVHEYMNMFVSIDGHRTWERLKKLQVYDLDKTWSACQCDDGSCFEIFS